MGKAPNSPAPEALSLNVSISTYPAGQASIDTARQIDSIEDIATSRNQIVQYLQEAAQVLQKNSIRIRQTSGEIPPNHANWQTLRNELTNEGYSVQVANALISW